MVNTATCTTCNDSGTVYIRCGVNDWDSVECPDCAPDPGPPLNDWPPPTGRLQGVRLIGGHDDGTIAKLGGRYIIGQTRIIGRDHYIHDVYEYRFKPSGETVAVYVRSTP